MITSEDQALYLLELVQKEMYSEHGNMLPLYDIHQLIADYLLLLRDVEEQKTIEAMAKRIT